MDLQLKLVSIFVSTTILLSGCSFPPPDSLPVVDPSANADLTSESVAATSDAGDSDAGDSNASQAEVAEQRVEMIPLAGVIAQRDAEISAMAWYGDSLVLVPQFPGKFGSSLYLLNKADILAFLDGTLAGPLEPTPIPFDAGELATSIYRYQGFEAISFVGDRVFLTIEAGGFNETLSYLVGGTIAPDLSGIVLDTTTVAQILPQAAMGNTGDETLVATADQLFTIYEGNGVNINTFPVAHVFDFDLADQGVVRFPNIEYRITDATALDSANNFWAINYFYPGDGEKYQPLVPEPLRETFGAGSSHAKLLTVERLVEFHLGEDGITLTERPPIQISLVGAALLLLGQSVGDQISRNWEGIVRLDDRGFLLVTDKFPNTLLGFVPMP